MSNENEIFEDEAAVKEVAQKVINRAKAEGFLESYLAEVEDLAGMFYTISGIGRGLGLDTRTILDTVLGKVVSVSGVSYSEAVVIIATSIYVYENPAEFGVTFGG